MDADEGQFYKEQFRIALHKLFELRDMAQEASTAMRDAETDWGAEKLKRLEAEAKAATLAPPDQSPDCKQCHGTGEMVTHTSDQARPCNVCGGSGTEPGADQT